VKKLYSITPREMLWWELAALFIILLTVWCVTCYFAFKKYIDQYRISPVVISLVSSAYLSPNEDEEIRFALDNIDDKKSDVTLSMICDRSTLLFMGLSANNDIYKGTIQSREQVNRQMKIYFPFDITQGRTPLGKNARLSILGGLGNATSNVIAELPISISPIPKNKYLASYLFAFLTGLTLWMAKEYWHKKQPPEK
jgi:hypothetical protein